MMFLSEVGRSDSMDQKIKRFSPIFHNTCLQIFAYDISRTENLACVFVCVILSIKFDPFSFSVFWGKIEFLFNDI